MLLTARTDLPRPPSDAEVTQALEGLKNRSPFTVRDAAKKVAKMQPVEKHRKEVAAELLAATTRSHGPGAEAALQRGRVGHRRGGTVPAGAAGGGA